MKSVFYIFVCLALVGCSSKLTQSTPGYIDYKQDGEMQKIKILSESEIDAIPDGAGGKYIIDHFGMGVKSDISGLLYPGYTGKKDAKGYFDLGDVKCEYLFLIDSMTEDRILELVVSPRNDQLVIVWPTRLKACWLTPTTKRKRSPTSRQRQRLWLSRRLLRTRRASHSRVSPQTFGKYMKTLRRLLIICATLLAFGCAHKPAQKLPFVIGSAYSITSSGAYWLWDIDGSDMKVYGPIRVRILELRPPAWALVQLLDEKRSPFWINLQDATSINEIK